MYISYDHLSEQEVRKELDKYTRLFDVAFNALLCIAAPGNARDLQKDAQRAIDLIGRYPADPVYSFEHEGKDGRTLFPGS